MRGNNPSREPDILSWSEPEILRNEVDQNLKLLEHEPQFNLLVRHLYTAHTVIVLVKWKYKGGDAFSTVKDSFSPKEKKTKLLSTP